MVSRILNGVDRKYLIRAWLIGLVFFVLIASMSIQTKNGAQYGMIIYSAVCTLLFPFSKLVWDEIKNLVIGQNVFYMNALMLIFLKIFINALLWSLAPFVALLGIGYIWYRTKSTA